LKTDTGNYDRSSRSDNSRNQNPERVLESFNNSDQLLTRLGSLQFDMKLTEEQLPNWSKFDSKVRTYIEDLEREKIRSIPVPVGLLIVLVIWLFCLAIVANQFGLWI
jgi:hypothetical protein